MPLSKEKNSHYDHVCSHERFIKDIANHQMHILHDDGVYRHVRYKRPDTSAYYFDLVTWPGHLAITGDMGANLFGRTEDMFKFFRQAHGCGCINPGYWAEKLKTDGERNNINEFDEDAFKRVINKYRLDWMRSMKENGDSKEDRRDLWEAVEDNVLCYLEYGAERVKAAAYEFSHRIRRDTTSYFVYSFEDLFEHSFSKFTFHYIWRCRAIAWAIEQYDAARRFSMDDA